jgi:ATP-dependent DNA helicase RecG
MPGFKMANLVRDVALLKLARDAARELLSRDPDLKLAENQLLRDQMEQYKTAIVG